MSEGKRHAICFSERLLPRTHLHSRARLTVSLSPSLRRGDENEQLIAMRAAVYLAATSPKPDASLLHSSPLPECCECIMYDADTPVDIRYSNIVHMHTHVTEPCFGHKLAKSTLLRARRSSASRRTRRDSTLVELLLDSARQESCLEYRLPMSAL